MNITLPELSAEFYKVSSPMLLLVVSSLVFLLLSVAKTFMKNVGLMKNLNILVLSVAFLLCVLNLASYGGLTSFLAGGVIGGKLGFFGQALVVGIALVVSLLISSTHLSDKFHRGDLIALFHMSLTGMLSMMSTDDLITLFIGLEMASLGIYALVGYIRPTKVSQEAAVKYFILGSIAAAIFLFGVAFLYATTGTFKISEMAAALSKVGSSKWTELGAVFLIAGLGFKLSLVPFHMWTPDAYEGAPTGITAFMATAVKVMILVACIRLFDQGLSGLHAIWLPTIGFLAAGSMLFANIMALAQISIKRMLAYSSIAHSGYMALSFAAMSGTTQTHQVSSILFYLVAYIIVSLGAFAVVMWLENERCENLIIDDLAGLAKSHPRAAMTLAVFMLSLGGMPPTVGFMGKLYVFNAALSNDLIWLVVAACVGSTISLYYYLRVIVKMFMTEPSPALSGFISPKRSVTTAVISGAAVVLILALGTFAPEPLIQLVKTMSSEVSG